VVIAVISVGVVEMAVDQIVHMVPVGDRLVPTARPVDMVSVVASAPGRRGARARVILRDRDAVLVHMISVGVVEMAVVEIVDVPVMEDRLVAAAGPVDVIMRRMGLTVAHRFLSLASLEAIFFDVIEGVGEQLADVMIRDSVVDMFPAAFLDEEPRPMELLEPLGDGRDLLSELLRQL
jgi:hypothetical protein